MPRVARAAQWRLAAALVIGAAQLGVGIVLAHLLAPGDFGVVASATLLGVVVQQVFSFGIGAAVIQRAALTERHIRTAFTVSVLLGVIASGVVFVGAHVGGLLLSNVAVIPVLRAMSLVFIFRGIGLVAQSLLSRQLDFKRQFFIDGMSYAVAYGAVAVALAHLGFGAWSLVAGGLLQTLIASVAQLGAVRHTTRPLLARRELFELLQFGLGASLSGIVNGLALNADNFVVGRWMGSVSLAFYDRSYQAMNLPFNYGAGVLATVVFPVFSQLQDSIEHLRRGYLLLTELTAIIAGPTMAIVIVTAPHLIVSVLGEQWLGMVTPLQILCVGGYFRALYHLDGSVAQGLGRTYAELSRQVCYASLVVVGALTGLRFGLPGVAIGVDVAILFMFVASGQLVLRLIGTSWRIYLRAQTGACIATFMAASIALLVRRVVEIWEWPSASICLVVVLAGSLPWSVAMLWTLARSDFAPLREHLPSCVVRLTNCLQAYRPATASSAVR